MSALIPTDVIDQYGLPVYVGSIVRLGDGTTVEVVNVTEPDGDVDEEGRGYGIAPRVTVQFGDLSTDTYSTAVHGGYLSEQFICDDVEVVKA